MRDILATMIAVWLVLGGDGYKAGGGFAVIEHFLRGNPCDCRAQVEVGPSR